MILKNHLFNNLDSRAKKYKTTFSVFNGGGGGEGGCGGVGRGLHLLSAWISAKSRPINLIVRADGKQLMFPRITGRRVKCHAILA